MSKVLRINFTQKIKSLSILNCSNNIEANILATMYRGLYKTVGNKTINDLVNSDYVYNDNKIWNLELKEVYWSNGKQLTTDDILQSWVYILKNKLPNSSQLFIIDGAESFYYGKNDSILGVKVTSKKTISITLKYPTPFFREIACKIAYRPIYSGSVEFLQKNPHSKKIHITNGKYQISHFCKDYIEVSAINNKEKISKIIFSFINDSKVLLDKLKNYEIDIHDGGPIGDKELYKEFEKYIKYYSFLSTYFLFINTTGTLNNEKFRQQFSYSISRDSLVKGNDKNPTSYLIPKEIVNWNREDELIVEQLVKMNLEGPLKFICNNEPLYIELALSIINIWESKFNVEIKLEVYEWDIFYTKLTNGDFDIARGGLVFSHPDPLAYLEVLNSHHNMNFSRWEHDKFDELLENVKRTGDEKIREDLFKRLETIIHSSAPIIPIYTHSLRQLVGDRVANYFVSHSGLIEYDSLSLKGGEENEEDHYP
jgi:oligopeptide transport system substrate-binding protein